MPKKKETRLKGFWLRVDQIKKISSSTKYLGITESALIRNLLDGHFGLKNKRDQKYIMDDELKIPSVGKIAAYVNVLMSLDQIHLA